MDKYDCLICFIAAYAREIGANLSKTQLIKFLYLADLFYARECGKTFTGWQWRYWHYGPYCKEVIECIAKTQRKGLIFVEEGYEGEFFIKGSKFSSEHCEQNIPAEILLPLKHYIKKFAGDLTALLDYIYSETEPMLAANYGDYLDFSGAQKLPPLPKIHLPRMSKERLKRCRTLIKQIAKEREQILRKRMPAYLSPKELEIVKEVYRIWNEEESLP